MSQLLARTAAHAAYQAAIVNPATTNWRELAETLFSALPALSKAARASGFPTWWADYELPRAYLSDSLDVLFADGEMVRVNIHRATRGLPRVPAACRAAIGFYRERHGYGHAVPAFASLTVADTGATFDAAACSAFTAELRAIPGTVARRAVTVDAMEGMAREVERRRIGLSRAHGDNSLVTRNREETHVSMWRDAFEGGLAELNDMRARFEAQTGQAAPEVILAPLPRLDAEQAIGHLADWHDAEPEAFELAGTFDAEAGTVRDEAAPVVYGIRVVNELAVSAVEPVAEPEATLISAATIVPADLNVAAEPADEWCPDERSHPVVALALSHRAREELFARVQDGTFADGARTAKCGAWRVTLQDALDLQDIASVRWVGLPRKPHARKAVVDQPLATEAPMIPAPVPAPAPSFDTHAAAFYPGALRPDCVLTLHGPSM